MSKTGFAAFEAAVLIIVSAGIAALLGLTGLSGPVPLISHASGLAPAALAWGAALSVGCGLVLWLLGEASDRARDAT